MEKFRIFKHEPGELYKKAGDRLVEEIGLALEAGRKTLVLLSGGSSIELYAYIFGNRELETGNPDMLAFGQIDERFFGNSEYRIQSSEINSDNIGKTGFWRECKRLGIAYHLISQEGSLAESAGEYDELMKKLFAGYEYKIAVLGIGTDGHTAGMLPGYAQEWNPGQMPEKRLYVGYRNDGKFPERITITAAGLREMDYGFVVVGAEKGNIINGIMNRESTAIKSGSRIMDPDLDSFPALVLRQMKRVEVFTE